MPMKKNDLKGAPGCSSCTVFFKTFIAKLKKYFHPKLPMKIKQLIKNTRL